MMFKNSDTPLLLSATSGKVDIIIFYRARLNPINPIFDF